MGLPFALPPLDSDSENPIWTKDGFFVENQRKLILEYNKDLLDKAELGWADGLTAFHEENAGENHFVDVASRQHAISQLKKYMINDGTILEIGCSSGFLLKEIKAAFPQNMLIGADIVKQPLIELANKMPTIPLMRFNLTKCPLPDNCVDAIVMLNVLEHIDDHVMALQQVFRILKPGGVLVIEVPAGPQLYDCYDKLLLHFRRYKLADLVSLTKQVGFEVLKKSHLGVFIYPPFAFVKYKNQKKYSMSLDGANETVKNNISKTADNPLLNMLMKLELFLGHVVTYPIGIRCLLTCRKISE